MADFTNAKVGDKVIIHTRYTTNIGEITKVNKTTVQVTRSDGYVEGLYTMRGTKRGCDAWHMNYIFPATPESIQKVNESNRRVELEYFLKRADYSKLSISTLERICEIVKRGLEVK